MIITASAPNAPHRIVAYPPRSLATALLGYNMGGSFDNAHVDLAVAGGASILRVQFGWDTTEDYATGVLSLSGAQQTFLAYCASKGVKPLIVAAYSPPRQTIGTLTASGTVANGSPAGTSIPVNSYGFSITPGSTDFAGGLFFGYPNGLTTKDAYYGNIITGASANAITLGAALNTGLTAGSTINVQRLRYAPPSTDADASNAAFVRYATFLASQIAAAGAQGYVDIWNEYQWGHDRWDSLGAFYDTPPGGITISGRMKQILTLCQAASLPGGTAFVNGVADKSGGNSIAVQGLAGRNFAYDSWHPYGNNPEEQSWAYYGFGPTTGQYKNASGLPSGAAYATDPSHNGWDTVHALDEGGNFRGMAFASDLKPSGPWPPLMITESGLPVADDTQQARWNTRKMLSAWGVGSPCVIYALDLGGSDTTHYGCAPGSVARLSYTAMQRCTQVLGHMGTTPLVAAIPHVVGWASDAVPLMAVTVRGNTPGHSTLFAWQRTWINSTDTINSPWTNVASPASQPVSIYLPPGVSVKEAVDVITGGAVTVTGPTSNVITVPVTDNPVAIRFGP